MDPALDPYAPGAGTPPPELTGRGPLLENARIALTRTRNRLPTKSFILVGLRGVGKTVLLNRVEDQARSAGYPLENRRCPRRRSQPAAAPSWVSAGPSLPFSRRTLQVAA